ncbi:MAG: class I SAM-dependent methyltransferase [Desulfobacteraceae bacterium]|nr:MAG: class I SAM-dependent methyltransferase [Desulfobacteraceae bacterium]
MAQAGFNEKVKLNVKDNFDQSCRMYNLFEEKHHFFASLAMKLAESINLKPNSIVLDIGCGNGISAQILNKYFSCRVLGVDLSEKMIESGKLLCDSPDIRLLVGDGEKLADIAGDQVFDYVLYNASIFIFPDVEQTIREAAGCLGTGGKIAFSFYPFLEGYAGEDLLAEAFIRLGEPVPRFRVITDYDKACRALSLHCERVIHHRWVRPLDIEFLQDFFSIPAQSASLFPGRGYEVRRELVCRLFLTLSDLSDKASIVWRMAEGTKAA